MNTFSFDSSAISQNLLFVCIGLIGVVTLYAAYQRVMMMIDEREADRQDFEEFLREREYDGSALEAAGIQELMDMDPNEP